MRKATGSHIIDCHDQYGHKVKSLVKPGFTTGRAAAREWEERHDGNTAVVYRILYNTVDNKNDKWGHNERD